MATIPTPEQTARHILEIFVFHFNCRPGHTLSQNNFHKIWRDKRLNDDDFGPGMDYAAEKGWVAIFDRGNSYRLTEAGFEKADVQNDPSKISAIEDAGEKIDSLSSSGNRVFIVHGHDLESLEKLKDLLIKIGLNPANFDSLEKAGSPTVIEILETNMPQFDAVIALFTPDDEGRKRSVTGGLSETHEQLRPRARQNVLIEAGYAIISRRHRSLIVALGGVDIPSDFEGIHRLEHDTWRSDLETKIASRLAQMGFTVNFQSLM